MQKIEQQGAKAAFNLHDVIYILFRHKWKILFLSVLGFLAAAFVYSKREPVYVSEAKLLVKYVLVRENMDLEHSQINVAGGLADHVLNTEIEILKSADLALEVAEAMGTDMLIPGSNGNASIADGAGVILGGLEVYVLPRNNVINIVYTNRDKELSRTVLAEVVKHYFVKHLEIHRSAAAFDMVSKQADEARARLKETEHQLDLLKTNSGITSLEDATSALANQRAKTQEDLIKLKAELADFQARMKAMRKSAQPGDAGAETPMLLSQEEPGAAGQVPQQVITEYKAKTELLAFLQKRDLELQMKFKPGNRLITLNRQQMEQYDTQRRELLAQYPQLNATITAAGGEDNILGEQAQIAAVNAKIDFFTLHLQQIKKLFSEQYAVGAEIEVLERKKQMEDAEYRSLVLNLKNAKLDQTLDPSRMPNITMVQHPSTPVESYDDKMNKLILGLAGAGMALGVGIAFLIELLIDRRVKRPTEIQTRLQLPLLLIIPYVRPKDRGGLMLSQESELPRLGVADHETHSILANKDDGERVHQRMARHFILPYAETVRDRIIFNFEVNDITHKPKLVAVTSLSEGAGATTVAAGLAKSFAEIRNAKVLLVDLSSLHAEANPMLGEASRHSLSGALQLARSQNFKQDSQNLYFASAVARREDTGISSFSLLHLYELLPHLQASQFDYIIFDMPPIDQTSRTLTMAGLMDKVLLVLDGENTSRDALKWGYSELVKGRADVSCIFNKSRSQTPQWLTGQN
jgi:polysaccharide biosynthesis transport protein